MKFIFILFFLSTAWLLAITGTNPHDINIQEIDKNKNCIDCHTLNSNNTPQTDINTTSAISSLACLNCHDGVSAENRDINIPGSGGYYPTSNYSLNEADNIGDISLDKISTAGTNLDISHGHPISILYIEGIGNLRSKNSIVNNWSTASNINDILIDGKIECGSCHNPHEEALGLYLRHKNKSSELCTSCHNK